MPPERTEPGSPADWLQRARSSYALACVTKPNETCWEDLCFQAQQAAEKATKAVMLHKNVRFPYVHDLAQLLAELERDGIAIPEQVKACVSITSYAFQTRYPGDYEPVTEADYRKAIEQAGAVLEWADRIIAGNGERET